MSDALDITMIDGVMIVAGSRHNSTIDPPRFTEAEVRQIVQASRMYRFGSQSGALSAREAHVAARLIAGDSYKEAGSALGIATNTVRHHVRNLYRKLGIRGRAALIRDHGELAMIEAPR